MVTGGSIMAQFAGPNTQAADAAFFRSAMREPLLERDHELELARRWREDGDEKALHRLVRAYTRLVIGTASRFRHYGLPLADLVQEGNVGLMQAAARFEPEREIRFSTYATWWIRSAMQDYILRNWSIVRIGTTTAQKSLFFNLRRLRARLQDPSETTMSGEVRDAIAERLGVPLRDVEAMEGRLGGQDQSLNATVSEDGEDDWQGLLADERPSPEQVVTGMRDSRTLSKWLAEALADLNPRERIIIDQRRLREEGATLEELGRDLGISKERVRQLESRALLKLRERLADRMASPNDLIPEF
ncbi:RNA polymerase factor sigma-32 [Thalassobaculum fulvum]|uniref:RNA polymerase sigma factor n=2 Tax=Thalassobaculum fulvum TaxID=1633335 RepID=A0A918XY49_9PROT|nr:RNA polymerase factor sigma-32 [Thalassobaculum fulvum]